MDIGHTVNLPVHEASQVAAVRRRAQEFADAANLGEVKAGQLAIIGSEMSTNLIKHAGGGHIIIQLTQDESAVSVDILSLDKGQGMINVEECMKDGFSTFGSPGTGLGAIKRQSDEFDLYSMPGKGTVIWSRLGAESPKLQMDVAGLSIPMDKETVCGDAWTYFYERDMLNILVSDGLGHGPLANEASVQAVRIFHERREYDVASALQFVHKGLRSTRGAAASVVALNVTERKINFCGVGNVTGLVASPQIKQFVTNNGTLGHTATRFTKFDYVADEAGVLILYSDGLQTIKSMDAYPGLLRRRAMVISGVLYRDLARGRDDTTVVVAKSKAA